MAVFLSLHDIHNIFYSQTVCCPICIFDLRTCQISAKSFSPERPCGLGPHYTLAEYLRGYGADLLRFFPPLSTSTVSESFLCPLPFVRRRPAICISTQMSSRPKSPQGDSKKTRSLTVPWVYVISIMIGKAVRCPRSSGYMSGCPALLFGHW